MSSAPPKRPPARLLSDAVSALAGVSDVVGVGIDLVDTEEVSRLIAEGGQAFLNAAWTSAEQADADRTPRRLAGRWAVKEAVMKALQVGIGDLSPLHVEIRTQPSGSLYVVLHGPAVRAARRQRIAEWRSSLSYGGDWALGVAVGLAARCRLRVTTNHRRSAALERASERTK